jgi:hypothetical protein
MCIAYTNLLDKLVAAGDIKSYSLEEDSFKEDLLKIEFNSGKKNCTCVHE